MKQLLKTQYIADRMSVSRMKPRLVNSDVRRKTHATSSKLLSFANLHETARLLDPVNLYEKQQELVAYCRSEKKPFLTTIPVRHRFRCEVCGIEMTEAYLCFEDPLQPLQEDIPPAGHQASSVRLIVLNFMEFLLIARRYSKTLKKFFLMYKPDNAKCAIINKRVGCHLILILLISLNACRREQPMSEKQKYPTVDEKTVQGKARTSFDSPQPTPSQLARKAKSIAAIKELGLPFIDHLPVIEDETAINPRSAEEVAERALALAIVAVKGEANDQQLVHELIARYSARELFTPAELAFITNRSPTQQQLTDFTWQYECLHVLLWALGHIEKLQPPNQICDVPGEVSIIRDLGRQKLSSTARPRALSEILDQADYYYRLHWAAVELRINGKSSDKANEEIIGERHKALNWLIRYMDQNWDDVTTDT